MGATGLETLKKVFAAGGFGRGIGRTLGLAGTEVAHGKVTLQGSPTPDHYNPAGAVHGGYVATLLDGAIALAVYSTLPADAVYSTLDLKITYLRSLTEDSGPVRAEASVIHSGRTVVAAEARLLDNADRLCAHATGTCIVGSPKR
ncbi:PaaI family thioesterase [Aquabacterium sp.]|uniref:PaaI family thioesterase n=1 Tax=Aquabacterium sp. TaxID=1872578 RepID=UPI002CBA8861|nr:PaaI family thioesterase [Aquabacterium sp.]HSW04421.1 PaaI family thioesterase [Aquabacterium sp.]